MDLGIRQIALVQAHVVERPRRSDEKIRLNAASASIQGR
jgi:hypothetical protein